MAERDAKDRSTGWLIENHGDSLLRVAEITGFTGCPNSRPILSMLCSRCGLCRRRPGGAFGGGVTS